MKYITPGIFENLSFSSKTNVNDKGTLELHFQSIATPDDVVNAWTDNTIAEQVSGKFLIFAPMMNGFVQGSDAQVPKTAAEIGTELQVLRKLLTEYAMLVGTKEAAEAAFGGLEAFKGIGIAEDEIPAYIGRLDDENLMKKVYTNMVTKFTAYIKSVPNYEQIGFRHKFFRKSEKEHYAVIPNSRTPYPFESMQVPKEASKINWTEWEIANKKNDATPGKKAEKTEVKQAKTLFKPRTPEATDTKTADSVI